MGRSAKGMAFIAGDPSVTSLLSFIQTPTTRVPRHVLLYNLSRGITWYVHIRYNTTPSPSSLPFFFPNFPNPLMCLLHRLNKNDNNYPHMWDIVFINLAPLSNTKQTAIPFFPNLDEKNSNVTPHHHDPNRASLIPLVV